MSAPITTAKIPHNLNLTSDAIIKISLLAIAYVLLIFILPSSPDTRNAYHLSRLDYGIVDFAVNMPSIVVWFAAFAGSASLFKYAKVLDGTHEGEYFYHLAKGCNWLAWSLPLAALISLILSSISYKFPGFKGASIIISNYISLIFPLIAFTVISNASEKLVGNMKLRLNTISGRILIALFLSISVVYCYLTFSRFYNPDQFGHHNPFYLPVWVMIATVIIPYLYAWSVGLTASYQITQYSKQVKGLLYRRSLQLLVSGLVTIIISLIALQYVNGIVPRVGHLVLNAKLIATIVFRLINGAGFILLTLGALKLKKIEDV
jgi:hypothetical protein